MYRLGYVERDFDYEDDIWWRALNGQPVVRDEINRRMARATGLPLRVFDGSAKRDSTEDWQPGWQELEQDSEG